MNERISPSHSSLARPPTARLAWPSWMALSTALGLCAPGCTFHAAGGPVPDVDLTPATAATSDASRADASVADASREALQPGKSDASVNSLDAGSSARPGKEMTDASARVDAQITRSGDGAVEMDFCGQTLPFDPSESGVLADSVVIYPALAQHPSVAPRGPAVSGPFGARVMWMFGEARAREDQRSVVAENSYTLSGFDRPYELQEAASDAERPASFVPAQVDDLATLAEGDTLHYELGSLISIGPTESLLL
jgi:hypothetical protein